MSTDGQSLSEEDCLQLGFRKSELECSRCDDLTQFNLIEIKPSCLSCCMSDGSNDSSPVSCIDDLMPCDVDYLCEHICAEILFSSTRSVQLKNWKVPSDLRVHQE